jgi:phage terminase small subunit
MSTDTPQTFLEALRKLDLKPRAFVSAYVETMNGAEAARQAKYSPKTARVQASTLLTKPNIREAIELGFKEKLMGQHQVLNRFQDVALGTMADFVTLEEIEYREKIPVPAFERREQLRGRIADARESMESVTVKAHQEAWQKIIATSIDELEGLPENPLDAVMIEGNIRKAVVARVDLVKAEKAGKLHLIKKLKQTERGLEVELYDAVNALEMIGKHYKLFTDRMSLENADGTPLVISVNVNPAPPRPGLEGIDDD